MSLIDGLGFDTVGAGTLDESWRFGPGSGSCTRICLANLNVLAEHILQPPPRHCRPTSRAPRWTPPTE
ncbi:hypothetical protein ACFYMI_23315 [Streptomyces collinus]|uniref:hypothetical protein n=1 Tax=Streptomyces collinus TaxID=42684 RepID=UPI0036BA041C